MIFNYRRPTNYLLTDAGERAYRVAYDKHGGPYKIFRAMHHHRPGQGFIRNQQRKEKLRELLTAAAPWEKENAVA